MRRSFKSMLALTTAAMMAFGITGCGNSGNATPDVQGGGDSTENVGG